MNSESRIGEGAAIAAIGSAASATSPTSIALKYRKIIAALSPNHCLRSSVMPGSSRHPPCRTLCDRRSRIPVDPGTGPG
ncbi:hypothetical protein D9M73_118330 [compost metagenome]